MLDNNKGTKQIISDCYTPNLSDVLLLIPVPLAGTATPNPGNPVSGYFIPSVYTCIKPLYFSIIWCSNTFTKSISPFSFLLTLTQSTSGHPSFHGATSQYTTVGGVLLLCKGLAFVDFVGRRKIKQMREYYIGRQMSQMFVHGQNAFCVTNAYIHYETMKHRNTFCPWITRTN